MSSSVAPKGGDIYAAFAGDMDTASLQRIFAGVAAVTKQGAGHLHLLFQSTGGLIGDGVCLYEFFRSLRFPLTLYNVGTVSSVAVVAFLGAEKRKASARATFVLHRARAFPQTTTTARLKSLTQTFQMDNGRTDAILKERADLSLDHWAAIDRDELTLSAQEAKDVKIIDEVVTFALPLGAELFSI